MLAVARLPENAPPQVSGTCVVDLATFRKKLGRPAFHVWQVCSLVRDSNGRTHITQNGIGKFKGFEKTKPDQVKKALARLRDAGLITSLGWEEMQVRRGVRFIKRKVFVRLVRGAILMPRKGKEEVAVPKACAEWLKSACAWGGTRSARMDSHRSKPVDSHADEQPFSRVPKGGARVPDPPSVSTRDHSEQGGQEYPPITLSKSNKDPSPSEKDNAAGAAWSNFVGETPVGLVLMGSKPKGPLILSTTTIEGVPPYPVYDHCLVPSPPLLDEDADPEQWVRTLATCYRGAVESRLKERCWAFMKGAPRTWKDYDLLVDGARELIKLEIAPAAWAAWSCDVWKYYSGEKKEGKRRRKKRNYPPVRWMFAPKRINERRGWFRREELEYEGQRVIYGPAQKLLFKTYYSMRYEIGKKRGTEEPAVVARRYFPGDEYERMLNDAKAEVKDYNERLERQIREGRWVW